MNTNKKNIESKLKIYDLLKKYKEVEANKKNLLSILKKEFPNTKFKEGVVFGKKLRSPFNKSYNAEMLLKFIWSAHEGN